MFTGIITDIGEVVRVEARGDARFRLRTAFDLTGVDIGASIACSGVCLTVVDKDPGAGTFDVDVSGESLDRTKLGDWKPGTPVNLERSLRMGDEMGGHIVTGHVDGLARVVSVEPEGASLKAVLELPDSHAGLVAAKGSIALDGVSLTVNGVEGGRFWINVIPHTRSATTFGTGLVPEARLNFEIDILARYVARLQEWRR